MNYLIVYGLLLAAGLMQIARAMQPATFSKEIVAAVLAAAVVLKIVSLWHHE